MCLWCVCFVRASGELDSFKSNIKLFWRQKRNAELLQEECMGFAVPEIAYEHPWRGSVVGTPPEVQCSGQWGEGVLTWLSPQPVCVCNSVPVWELPVSR